MEEAGIRNLKVAARIHLGVREEGNSHHAAECTDNARYHGRLQSLQQNPRRGVLEHHGIVLLGEGCLETALRQELRLRVSEERGGNANQLRIERGGRLLAIIPHHEPHVVQNALEQRQFLVPTRVITSIERKTSCR